METVDIMRIVVLAATLAVCGFAVWALVEVAKAMRSVRALSDGSRERLEPLLDKADVTVDAVNAELLRVDAIITRFEEAGERVSSASGTLSGIVHAPSEIVSEVADRVRRAWKDRKRESDESAQGQADEPASEQVPLMEEA